MKIKSALLALALTLYASSALAGWVFVQDSGGQTLKVYVQDNKVRTGSGEHGVIYDVSAGTVTIFKPAQKQYWTGRPQDLSQQMNRALDSRMEQMLKQAPPEQRDKLRQMMQKQMGRGPQGPAAKVEVKPTGKSQKIAGYLAKQYRVLVNGQPRQELWVGQVPGLGKDLDIAKLFGLVQQMKISGRPSWRNSPQVAAVMAGGYPLKMVEMGGGPSSTTITKKVEKKSLPAELFRPPKGWTKVSFDQMMR